jgi:hypothetical protein
MEAVSDSPDKRRRKREYPSRVLKKCGEDLKGSGNVWNKGQQLVVVCFLNAARPFFLCPGQPKPR